MSLHENETLFRQAVIATAEFLGIPEIFIEKDYWVTYALHRIFHDEIGEQTVFKGGTALSKCYGLIDRFSEDIDLVVKHADGETDNQLKRKIRRVSKAVEEVLPEVEVDGLTMKRGMNRKTAHEYPRIFAGDFGQVRNVIVVEATWFGYFEPYGAQPLTSYIHDMMVARGQQEILTDYRLEPFEVNVLRPERTLCEKIMSLVRFSYGENPVRDLQMKIRHTYDLHKMLEDEALRSFFDGVEFDEFINRVAQDDVVSFRNNNEWLRHHPNECYLFSDVTGAWQQLKATYAGDFRGLVYRDFPDESLVLASLIAIQERMATVEWQVNIL